MRNITKLNEREIELGIESKNSWHNLYKDSAWIFIGGLSFDLSEGDIICVFSQYGEVVNINLVRDKATGKSKGFAFLCYEDQRSTILAVDNLNGVKITGRIVRVDHVQKYRLPKETDDIDEVTKRLYEEGCAPKEVTQASLLKPKAELSTSKEPKKEERKRSRRHSSDSSDSDTRRSSKRDKKHKKKKSKKSSRSKSHKHSSSRH